MGWPQTSLPFSWPYQTTSWTFESTLNNSCLKFQNNFWSRCYPFIIKFWWDWLRAFSHSNHAMLLGKAIHNASRLKSVMWDRVSHISYNNPQKVCVREKLFYLKDTIKHPCHEDHFKHKNARALTNTSKSTHDCYPKHIMQIHTREHHYIMIHGKNKSPPKFNLTEIVINITWTLM